MGQEDDLTGEKNMHPPTPLPELINFCLQPLVDVSSTVVSADDYPLSNLVSISPSVRSRGFRVEHFIRPPVQLDFEFRFPVNVACIIVHPELVPHSEMRLEVAASLHNASMCSNLIKICPNAVVNDNQTLLLLENKIFKKKDDGRVFSNFKTDLTSYRVEGSFMNQSVLSRALGTGVAVQPLKHPNILAKLRQLRFTVTRITGPRPLSLRSLEVWGSPSNGGCTTTPSQLECLWSCLTAVGRERSKASSEGVKLYCGKNSSPEQAPVAGQQDTITANDLHRTYADTGLACRYAKDQKLMSSHERKLTEVVCGSFGHEECHCECPRVHRGSLFGGAGTDTPEVGHIKELTSENKKSLKPQQRVAPVTHLHGCSHNIGKGKQKPGPSSSSCRSSTRTEWLEGKNGSLPSTSQQLQPNHNTSSRDYDKSISQYSCSLAIINNSKAAIDHKQQQQRLEDSSTQTLPTASNHPEVPSEFLDKITYEVMHIPMLLPSGHCVDRSTVEKLGNNDALHGRAPTDPFTGIPFSGTSKPEFFPELKLRLDRFLSSRTAEGTTTTTASARTLGTANQISAHLRRVGRTGGAGRCCRDGVSEKGSSQEPPPKRLRSLTMKDVSHAEGPGESACPSSPAAGVGSGAVWASPTTGGPSYGRGSPGSAIKDQRTTHRMPTHDHGPCSSSTQPNHNFQLARNQFEEEVAGSLDQALKQLLSD